MESMEGVLLAKGITNKQPMLAHGLGDIQTCSFNSSIFFGKRHHLNNIPSITASAPKNKIIYMYVL